MFRIEAIAVALIGGLVTVAAHADVYRWKDDQGHVHYSDQWTPGAVLIKSGTRNTMSEDQPADSQSDSQSDTQKLAARSEAISEQQAQESAEKQVKQDLAANKAQQCKEATAAYQKAIQSRRLYKEGKNGEREYVSDKEADAYRAQLVLERNAACGK